MFARPARSLLDALLTSLCLWAAAYHTPVGALVRSAGAWALGSRSSARPLFAYYSSGLYDGHARALARAPLPPPPRPGVRGPMPADEALAWGVYATLLQAGPGERAHALEAAARHGLAERQLLDAAQGPGAARKLLAALSDEVGPGEVALVALFCGAEPARFARQRATAEGRAPTLDELAAQLPPGFADPVALASQATTLGTAYALAWPVSEHARISSPFGVRMHPILGTRRLHTGVDLSVPAGTPVRATGPGVVVRASQDALNGRVIVVDHGRGVTTAYCHNDALLVGAGERIERGAVIARSGNTGRSTGPHLHYQLGVGGSPADPTLYRRTRPPAPAAEGLAASD